MRILLALLVVFTLSTTIANQAQALFFCIPQWDFDECHPADGGEPPNWCGSGRVGQVIGKIQSEITQAIDSLKQTLEHK